MPAGERIRGIDGVIEILNEASASQGEIPCLSSWELSIAAATQTVPTLCMLSNSDGGSAAAGGWDRNYLESKSWSLTAEFAWQEDDTAGAAAALDPIDVGSRVQTLLYPNTKDVGKVEYRGFAIITDIGVPSEASGEVRQTISFTGDDDLSRALVT